MRSVKKNITVAQAKKPMTSINVLKKLKSALTVNFPIAENADLNNIEISIKVNAREIIAQFYNNGELVSQQAIPVKKIPNPPPMPHFEFIKALEQLRFNFNIQR